MRSAYDKFQDRLSSAHNDWQRHFVLPYGSAYNTAYHNFEKTLELQKKADEAKRKLVLDLAMFALSLTGGSVLTAVFGSAASKNLARKAAEATIVRTNWDKAHALANFLYENKTGQFVAGALWDKAEDYLGGKVKSKLEEHGGNFQSFSQFGQRPQNLQNHLEMWVRDLYAAAKLAGEHIADHLDAHEKCLEALADSLFFKAAPRHRISESDLATDMELTFFMKFLTDTDYLARGYKVSNPSVMYERIQSKKPIPHRPGSSKYPKGKYRGSPAIKERFEKVIHASIGDIIKDRINVLYQKKFGKRFFWKKEGVIDLFDRYESNSMDVLQRAYSTLDNLGDRNRSVMKHAFG